MSLDLTKPVQTTGGRPVRVLCTDRNHPQYPIIGLVSDEKGVETIETWTAEGQYAFPGDRYSMDLINVPEEVNTYFNVYPDGEVGYRYPTLESAKVAANGYPLPTGQIRITHVDGKLTDVSIIS